MRVETLIIGCGIAGIGCARRLSEAGKEFLVVTEDIGGRILSDASGEHNYGALFALKDYEHLKKVATFTRRIPRTKIEFHSKGKHYFVGRILRHPIQASRLVRNARKFLPKYEAFKRRVVEIGQKAAIEADPELLWLYRMTAEQYMKSERIIDVGNEFVGEAVYGCTFLPLSKVSAFDFVRITLGFIVPSYEFIFHRDEAIAPFKERIVTDTVTAIDGKRVTTASGKRYEAKNLIVATPPHVAQQLLGIPIKEAERATLAHVRGRPKKRYRRGVWEAFDNSSPLIAIYKYVDGTYLIGSIEKEIDYAEYFDDFELLYVKHWDPAFNIAGDLLLDPIIDEGVYCIADVNVNGVEDCYVNGLFAAEQIIKKTEK